MAEPLAPLSLSTALFLHDLLQGDQVGFPVAEPDRVAYGDPDELQDELQLYLEERLREAPPEVLARYSVPAAVQMETVIVQLAVEGGPPFPVAVPVVLIPDGKARWCFVPPLEHTFYLHPTEALEEVAQREVLRMVEARTLDPFAPLALFPGREQSLRRVTVSISRAAADLAENAETRRKALQALRRRKQARETLAEIGTPLLDETPPEAPPLRGREAQQRQLRDLLGGQERLSVVLLGPPAVGKSALFRDWLVAQAAAKTGKLAYAVSGAQLIAGAGGFGRWQARVLALMDAAAALDAVLYFEDLAELFAERKTDGPDLAGAMRPYLTDNKVRIVGELDQAAVDRVEGKHVGFFSALHRLTLEPLDLQATKQIVEERLAFDRAQNALRPLPPLEAAPYVVELTERYLPYQSQPGKSVRFYDELRAFCEKDAGSQTAPLVRVFEAFSLKTGIPEKLLREDRSLAVEEVMRALSSRLIGQAEAVRRVAEVVCVVKAGLQPTGRPLATFLFVGPTGVGKTELARSLAAYLFGAESRMLRFDMSEYMDPEAAERLISGSAQGEGVLTRQIRKGPFCVLLLDEIEKAHPAVFDLLLQVLGEGRLTDARGRTAYFHNAIIIMTSNLGAAYKRPPSGFTSSPEEERLYYERQVERSFRPEFVNRLDRVISFAPLRPSEIGEVGSLLLGKIMQRRGFSSRGLGLRVSPRALEGLIAGGYSEVYGARALRRHFEDELVAPIAHLLGQSEQERKGAAVLVSTRDEPPAKDPALSSEAGALRFSLTRGESASSGRGRHHFDQLAELRRAASRIFGLERVHQVRERVEYLVSQLNASARRKMKDPRAQTDMAALQSDHYRLSTLWQEVARQGRELEDFEELALLALLDGQETKSYLDEALRHHSLLQRNFTYLLLCLEPRRDEITLLLQELDGGRALDWWLAPLLRDELSKRNWSVTCHMGRDLGPADPKWPSARRLGPARDPEQALQWLAREERPSRHLAIHVRGPYASSLLALERGLHKYRRVHHEKETVYLRVTPLALRALRSPAVGEDEWLHPELESAAPPSEEELRAEAASREYDANERRLFDGKGSFSFSLSGMEFYWQELERFLLLQLLSYEASHLLDRDDVFVGLFERVRTEKVK